MTERDPTSAELVELLVTVAHAVRNRINARMTAAGLSMAKFRVLRLLSTGERMRMNELSAALGVVPRTITTMVDALEGDGLVVRVDDPDDRRAILLEVTEAGRERLDQFRGTYRQDAAAGLFDVLSRTEKGELAKLLDRVREAVDAEEH